MWHLFKYGVPYSEFMLCISPIKERVRAHTHTHTHTHTASKLKNPELHFHKLLAPKKPERLRTQIFVDPGISHWAIQLDHFSNKRKVSNRGTDIDQYNFVSQYISFFQVPKGW